MLLELGVTVGVCCQHNEFFLGKYNQGLVHGLTQGKAVKKPTFFGQRCNTFWSLETKMKYWNSWTVFLIHFHLTLLIGHQVSVCKLSTPEKGNLKWAFIKKNTELTSVSSSSSSPWWTSTTSMVAWCKIYCYDKVSANTASWFPQSDGSQESQKSFRLPSFTSLESTAKVSISRRSAILCIFVKKKTMTCQVTIIQAIK